MVETLFWYPSKVFMFTLFWITRAVIGIKGSTYKHEHWVHLRHRLVEKLHQHMEDEELLPPWCCWIDLVASHLPYCVLNVLMDNE